MAKVGHRKTFEAATEPRTVRSSPSTESSSEVWTTQQLADTYARVRHAVPSNPDGRVTIDSPEACTDGRLVGGDGYLYPPSASMRTLPPVRAEGLENSPPPEQRVDLIHVNGILTKAAEQLHSMKKLANGLAGGVAQAEVRGVHSGTEGFIGDILQAVTDKTDIGRNRAIETLKNKVLDRVLAGEPANLVVHSHGSITASRALKEAKASLTLEYGYSRQEAESLLDATVRVVTTGNAQWKYPDGPQYRHMVNVKDGVATSFGLGSMPDVPTGSTYGPVLRAFGRTAALIGAGFRALRGDPGPVYAPGRGAAIDAFEQDNGLLKAFTANHSFEDVYVARMSEQRSVLLGEGAQRGFFLRADHRASDSIVEPHRDKLVPLPSKSTAAPHRGESKTGS
ncbi:MAG: hypothetical protein AAF449_05780 [Myxococcota bacterium]